MAGPAVVTGEGEPEDVTRLAPNPTRRETQEPGHDVAVQRLVPGSSVLYYSQRFPVLHHFYFTVVFLHRLVIFFGAHYTFDSSFTHCHNLLRNTPITLGYCKSANDEYAAHIMCYSILYFHVCFHHHCRPRNYERGRVEEVEG